MCKLESMTTIKCEVSHQGYSQPASVSTVYFILFIYILSFNKLCSYLKKITNKYEFSFIIPIFFLIPITEK